MSDVNKDLDAITTAIAEAAQAARREVQGETRPKGAVGVHVELKAGALVAIVRFGSSDACTLRVPDRSPVAEGLWVGDTKTIGEVAAIFAHGDGLMVEKAD